MVDLRKLLKAYMAHIEREESTTYVDLADADSLGLTPEEMATLQEISDEVYDAAEALWIGFHAGVE